MLPYPEIDPVALALGPLKIHWYGLAYLAGLGFAWWLAVRRSQRPWSPVARDQVDDLIFYSALGVVLGGRLGYAIFYGTDRLLEDPSWLLQVWQGGMSFHGGFLGVLALSGVKRAPTERTAPRKKPAPKTRKPAPDAGAPGTTATATEEQARRGGRTDVASPRILKEVFSP